MSSIVFVLFLMLCFVLSRKILVECGTESKNTNNDWKLQRIKPCAYISTVFLFSSKNQSKYFKDKESSFLFKVFPNRLELHYLNCKKCPKPSQDLYFVNYISIKLGRRLHWQGEDLTACWVLELIAQAIQAGDAEYLDLPGIS